MDRNPDRLLNAGQGASRTITHHTRTGTNRRHPCAIYGNPDAAGLLLTAWENYYYGGRRDLEVGNTEVLARMISELIDCDVYRINAVEPYPRSYDATVERNVREQNADARPAIENPLRRSHSTTPCSWAARSGTSGPR